MAKHITIALRADGTGEVLHGPEDSFATQRDTVQRYRDTDVPEGFERVEIWTRACTKFAYRQPESVKRRRELEALIAAEKAQQDGEQNG